MTANKPELFDDTLFKAARLRVSGLNWYSVGRELGAEGEELERQSYTEGPRWKELVRDAERDLFKAVGWECTNILRFLIRDDDKQTRMQAVEIYMKFWNGIIRHRPKGARKTSNPLDIFCEEEIPREHIAGLIRDICDTTGREPPPEGDDPEGPNRPVRVPPPDPSGAGLSPTAAVHRELQQHLSRHRCALVEMPRDHGKTTQVCLRVLWELGNNPNLRIKIVCANEAIARDRSRFLRQQIERNPLVHQVFPRLMPGYPWQAEAFSVQRRPGILGPSVMAFGVGGSSTGTRADLLVCDDIVDVTASIRPQW